MVLEIPLKSGPKVSVAPPLDNAMLISSAQVQWPVSRSRSPRTSARTPVSSLLDASASRNDESTHYKLARTYSETETNNFDADTGHRLFDDGRIRTRQSRASSPMTRGRNSSRNSRRNSRHGTPSLYTRSHTSLAEHGHGHGHETAGLAGIEDEYIPGLNFSDVISEWTRPSAATATTPAPSHSGPASRDVSYLDLKQLHAQVSPQPIQTRQFAGQNFNFNRNPAFTLTPEARTADPLKKKFKPTPDTDTDTDTYADASADANADINTETGASASASASGHISFEAVLASLPSNFNDLPYSQRKKMVKEYSESIDYAQFSQFARSVGSGGRSLKSDPTSIAKNGSFLRRSRRSSINFNTVAGRLLALSSSVDLKRLDSTAAAAAAAAAATPKHNVDEKGAYVMDHQLGKVIGFGAWGIIRECTSKAGCVRAVKIVKSTKVSDHDHDYDYDHTKPTHNPKVLRVFRQEIEIWRRLDHPHILPLLDSVETEHMIFCLTNRVIGGTLFDLVARWGPFDEGVAATSGPIKYAVATQRARIATTVKCARQVVEAMHYMHHELGIVHGDLKLENVLVEHADSSEIKMILCDFGMSRVFDPRVGRGAGSGDSASPASRSKSSLATIRRPYSGADAAADMAHSRSLFSDDSRIGISQLFRPSGLCSVSLSGSHPDLNPSSLHELKNKKENEGVVDENENESGVPHSHIGSLPYASPELLSPSPPPLGPSADVWALGVLLYTMTVGRLPFQHPYEPRLRAVITAGKINRTELRQSTLLASVIDDASDHSSSMVDVTRKAEIQRIEQEWRDHDVSEFEWFDDVIESCLERDITRRWDLPKVSAALMDHA